MVHMAQLFSIYQELLTDRQREVLSLYYEEDFSLAEIAEQYNITRQGVRDNLKRGEMALLNYEEVLHVNERRLKRLELYERLRLFVTQNEAIHIINQLISNDE